MGDSEASYFSMLEAARSENLEDLEARGFVRVWAGGRDLEGRRVVVLNPRGLLGGDRDRALRLFVRECDALADEKYRVVLVQSGRGVGVLGAVWAARRARAQLPRKYRKNLAAVTVIHPDAFVRMVAWGMSAFVSQKLWDKVQMVDRLEELVLDGVFQADDVESILPAECFAYEAEFEEEASIVRANARAAGYSVAREEDVREVSGDS